jgi:SHS2 domain-containing protein
MQKNYELIEHTADIGIRVKGGDLKELFKNSALAMFDIIAEKKTENRSPCLLAGESQVKRLVIGQKADNLEELLVNWLNELLSLSSAKD